MRILSSQEAALIRELLRIANGNLELVEQAIRNSQAHLNQVDKSWPADKRKEALENAYRIMISEIVDNLDDEEHVERLLRATASQRAKKNDTEAERAL